MFRRVCAAKLISLGAAASDWRLFMLNSRLLAGASPSDANHVALAVNGDDAVTIHRVNATLAVGETFTLTEYNGDALSHHLTSSEWSDIVAVANSGIRWSDGQILCTTVLTYIMFGTLLAVVLLLSANIIASMAGGFSAVAYYIACGLIECVVVSCVALGCVIRSYHTAAAKRLSAALGAVNQRYNRTRDGRLPCALKLEPLVDDHSFPCCAMAKGVAKLPTALLVTTRAAPYASL